MDVIPLDATLIKGSHGCVNIPDEFYPVIVTNNSIGKEKIGATEVYDVIWESLAL